MPVGFLAAQVVHAAGESIRQKLPPHTNAVVLSVPNEQALRDLHQKLENIDHELIIEIDEPYTGQATAIGLAPVSDRAEAKKVLSGLPLLKNLTCPGGVNNAQKEFAPERAGVIPSPGSIHAYSETVSRLK